ncbi:MAG: SPOR domain-containing protein [Oscillospiraceae bacterium]|nr:SPOR domain-containing protein [Oscillospiraceae bacterium]
MAVFLKPDKVKYWNGVTVNEYFLTDHNPNKISLPVKRKGEYIGITLHNTNRIIVSPETTPAEQYTRSTVNGNMNSVRVHFYVDDRCAWQNLPLDYSSWHAGQKGKAECNGSEKGNGNTISIECIMSGNGDITDIKARDNAARLIAYLKEHYGGELYTHNYWCNVRNGKRGTLDELNKLNDGYKGCPIYIRPSWDKFKTLVDGYMPVKKDDSEKLYYVQVGAFKSESLAKNYLNEVKRTYPSAFIKADGLYYVQVGAFRSKSNAEAFLFTVKEQYPSAFIKVM